MNQDQTNVSSAELADSKTELKYVALAHFPNSVEAGMVCELLTNNGVRALLRGEVFGGMEPLLAPGGFSEVTLEVAEPDFPKAEQLYEAFFAHPTVEEGKEVQHDE
ncbi:MAG TPA: DUF2007 domain-containing protein [Blastocatellia bacterium]|nr:DUF2007 domain-containing protein [Blastocatellia bacterium]